MEVKPAFDYKGHGLDEAKIDEIFSRRRCDEMVVRVPSAHLELSPVEARKFWKMMAPKKVAKKKNGRSGPYDYIIPHLTALIGQKNLSEEHRVICTELRIDYKNRQKAHREELNPPGKTRMFIEYIKRDQVHDLVSYIKDCNPTLTATACHEIAIQVMADKRKGILIAKTAKNKHYQVHYK